MLTKLLSSCINFLWCHSCVSEQKICFFHNLSSGLGQLQKQISRSKLHFVCLEEEQIWYYIYQLPAPGDRCKESLGLADISFYLQKYLIDLLLRLEDQKHWLGCSGWVIQTCTKCCSGLCCWWWGPPPVGWSTLCGPPEPSRRPPKPSDLKSMLGEWFNVPDIPWKQYLNLPHVEFSPR